MDVRINFLKVMMTIGSCFTNTIKLFFFYYHYEIEYDKNFPFYLNTNLNENFIFFTSVSNKSNNAICSNLMNNKGRIIIVSCFDN